MANVARPKQEIQIMCHTQEKLLYVTDIYIFTYRLCSDFIVYDKIISFETPSVGRSTILHAREKDISKIFQKIKHSMTDIGQ
jgi:hypothetical protein